MRYRAYFAFLALLISCAVVPEPHSEIKFSRPLAATPDRAIVYIYTAGSASNVIRRNIILNLEFIGELRIFGQPGESPFLCEFFEHNIQPGAVTIEFLELTRRKVSAIDRESYIRMRRRGETPKLSRFAATSSAFRADAGTVTYVRVDITNTTTGTLNEIGRVHEDEAVPEISRCFVGRSAT
jgi:hypothetical protein